MAVGGYITIAKSQKSLKLKINGEKYFVDLYQLSKAIESGYAPLIKLGESREVKGYVALSKNKKALIIKSNGNKYFVLLEHLRELLNGSKQYAPILTIVSNGNGNGNGKVNKLELAKETINKILPTRIEIFKEKLNKLLQ